MEEKSGRVTDLLDVRGKMFDECLNSICELIVSTSYCGTMLEKGKRMREIRNIKGIIRMYVESEREVLLSYLITFCNVRDEQNQKCEFESLRKKILAATIRPSLAKRLPTKTLLNHFFFEAMFVKSNCFKMRKIILQFVDNFRVSFTSFRKRVNEAMKVIMDRNTRAIELSTSALKEKQKDLAEMQDRVKSLATRLQGFVGDQSDSTSTQEEERVSELEQKLARQKEIISTLKLQLEKVKKELVKARTPKKKQEAFSDDTENLRLENKELKALIEKLNAENERLVDELCTKTDQIRNYHSLETELNLAHTQIAQKSQKQTDLQNENRSLKAKVEEVMAQKAAQQKEMRKQEKTITSITREIDQLKVEKETMEKEYMAKTNQLTTEQQRLQSKREPISYGNPKDTVQLDRLRLTLRLTEEELKDAKQTISQNNITMDEMRYEINQLKQQISDRDQEIERLATKPKQASHSRHFLPQQPVQPTPQQVQPTPQPPQEATSESDDSVEDKLHQSMEANREQSTIIYHLKQELSQQKAKKKNIASAYARVKDQLSRSVLADEQNKKKIEEMKQQLESLHNALEEKTEENLNLTGDIRRAIKRKTSKPIDERLTDVTNERDMLEAEIDQMKKQKRETDRTLRLTKRNLRSKDREIEKLNHQIMVLKREMLALQTMKTEAFVMYEHKTEDVQNQNKQYAQTIDELQAEVDELKDANSRLKTLLRNTTDQYEGEIHTLTEKMVQQRDSSEKISQSLIVENSKLQTQAARVYQKGKSDRTKIEDLENSIQYFKVRLEKANNIIRGQYQVIKELKNDASELQTLYKDANSIAFGKRERLHTVPEILSELHRLKSLRA